MGLLCVSSLITKICPLQSEDGRKTGQGSPFSESDSSGQGPFQVFMCFFIKLCWFGCSGKELEVPEIYWVMLVKDKGAGQVWSGRASRW